MADRLGPRACAVCGPVLEGCWRCGAKLGHAHVQTVDRYGVSGPLVAVCATHGPKATVPRVNGKRRVEADTAFVKRRRDRERRRAQRIVLERHADEVAQVLAEVRR